MSAEARTQGGVRVAEIVALLSLGTDLGLGLPTEHAMRQCLTALGLAERIGLDLPTRGVVYEHRTRRAHDVEGC